MLFVVESELVRDNRKLHVEAGTVDELRCIVLQQVGLGGLPIKMLILDPDFDEFVLITAKTHALVDLPGKLRVKLTN